MAMQNEDDALAHPTEFDEFRIAKMHGSAAGVTTNRYGNVRAPQTGSRIAANHGEISRPDLRSPSLEYYW